jgi:hypothetical protein
MLLVALEGNNMSRKDYIALVDAIARGAASGDVLKSIKQMLAQDNPKFNEKKFDDFLAKAMEKYT